MLVSRPQNKMRHGRLRKSGEKQKKIKALFAVHKHKQIPHCDNHGP